MPAAIAMAAAKLSPMLSASSKSSSSFTSSAISPSTSVSTISIPVSAFHDPTSNVITITPYIFVKTATVAEQMQALRQDKKIGKPPEQPAGALRVKRRTDLSKLGLPDAKPASVSRRNARERNRVKQVNMGFETLREHVPNGKKNKKMSKVQTLRSAAQYIKDLYMILHGELPALGSPTLIDDIEPNSPIDNSMCSISDTDNDVSVASPEPQFQLMQTEHSQHQEQNLTSEPQFQLMQTEHSQHQEQSLTSDLDVVPVSPASSAFSPNVTHSPPPHQQHSPLAENQMQKQSPLIIKKEQFSVLQQQLTSGQLSHVQRIANHMKYQQLLQQQQQKLVQQQQELQQHSQAQHEVNDSVHKQELQTFNPSSLRMDPLTCSTVLGLSSANSVLQNWRSALTFTELSPVSLVNEQCDNYVETSSEQSLAHLHNDSSIINMNTNSNISDNVDMDIPTSPATQQPYLNDVNMNVIGPHLTDLDALQNYYKSMHSESFKNADTCFVFQLDHKSNNNNNNNNINNNNCNFLIGQSSNVVHSPAPSLGSTSSTGSSEADVGPNGQYDYDNIDREALLDISNWISEICNQGMQLNETAHTQQSSVAYSY